MEGEEEMEGEEKEGVKKGNGREEGCFSTCT